MKKMFMILLVLFCFSCNENKNTVVEKNKIEEVNCYTEAEILSNSTIRGYKIVEIDSCEYIYCWFGAMNGGGSLTHKGNCKFCKERTKKQ